MPSIDQFPIHDDGEEAIWEVESERGILQITTNYATQLSTYEAFDFDEDGHFDLDAGVSISSGEAHDDWDIPANLYHDDYGRPLDPGGANP